MELKIGNPIPNEICFYAEKDKWIMKLTNKGIIFNREGYPDAKPDEFAQAVFEILEKEFSVKFEKKDPPYNKNESVTK